MTDFTKVAKVAARLTARHGSAHRALLKVNDLVHGAILGGRVSRPGKLKFWDQVCARLARQSDDTDRGYLMSLLRGVRS